MRPKGRLLELLNLAAYATEDSCAVWPYAVNTRGFPHLMVNGKQAQGHKLVATAYGLQADITVLTCGEQTLC